MSNDKQTSTDWQRISRDSVPSTVDLQSSILAATQHLPQQIESKQERRVWRFPRFIWQRFAAGAAGLAVLFVTVTVMLPTAILSPSLPVTSNGEQISLHELEIQELALLEDEILFAQL